MIDEQELDRRIDAANKKYVPDDDEDEIAAPSSAIVDLYQQDAGKMRDESRRRRPRGSSTLHPNRKDLNYARILLERLSPS